MIIASAALLVVSVGLLVRSLLLVRRGRRALLHSIDTEKDYIRREIELEKEKKALEARLKRASGDAPKRKTKRRTTTNNN